MRIFPHSLIALTGILAISPVILHAQAWGSIDLSIPMANTGYMLNSQIVAATIDYPSDDSDDTDDEADGGSDTDFILRRSPASKSAAPDLLAASYPEAERPNARRVFGELLAGYEPLMAQLGSDPNDYAAAAAVFVAGSYTALHGRDFDDRAFAPLVRDLRARMSKSGAFEATSLADKQLAVDQYAILGIMAALTHTASQNMAPGKERDQLRQNLRTAGKRYLEQTFGVPAENIVIDASGLRIPS